MNEIVKMISDETKRMVEESGKEYKEPDFDDKQPTQPTQAEVDEFRNNIVNQIDECAKIKKQEMKNYRRMFGNDPKGNAPISYTIPN
jgi:hypothetical protein